MILNRRGVEFYDVEIGTDPPVVGEGWEASFDDGDTWADGETVEGGVRWLVAGYLADAPEEASLILHDVDPLIRTTDHPEVIVHRGPRIQLET